MWRVVLLSWWLLGTLALCCPPDCRCFTDDDGYKVANCSKTGLLSGGLFPTIDVLNFKNQLRGSQTKLEARIFRNFRGLQILNLQNSSISHLPNDVFLGIGRVVRIDLSFNKIKHLNGVVFKPLQNLKELNLRGNSLSMSPLEVIVSATLEKLDMGYCNINSLPLHTFSSVPSLRHLILDGNSIQSIEYNVLPKGLIYINLAYNHIVAPPINVFNSLRYLNRLDLSNNPINCSCALLAFQDSLSGRAGILDNGVTCANPRHLAGRSINSVNENQLCRDDYAKKESSNSLVHSRRSRYHHHQYEIQSDEPLMGDESYGPRDAAEVMFTNDETNQMGTHMEARLGTHPSSYSEPSEDNELLEPTGGTSTFADNTDTSPELDPYQDLRDSDPVDLHLTSPEVEESSAPKVAPSETSNSPTESSVADKELFSEDLKHATEESYSGKDNIINLSSSDPSGEASDHSNTLHALDVGYNNVTESLIPSSPTDETEEPLWHTDEVVSDVEVLSNTTLGDETFSHARLAYEDTTTESSDNKRFTLPTSATEAADYSYDTQHDDYGGFDNATSSEATDWETPEQGHSSSSPSSTTEEEVEGSGEPEPDTTSEPSPSSSSVGFMEEQETETEPSLQTVSDDLVDLSSSSTPYDGLLGSSSTDMSSVTAPSTEPSTEASYDYYELSSSSETPSSEPSTEVSSSEPSTEPITTEPNLISSSTDHSSTPEDVTEQPTTETSTEPSTELPLVEVSTERLSTEPTYTEPSSTSELPSSSSADTPRGFWWDSDEDETSPSSSAGTPAEDASSSQPSHRQNKMIEFTTESSKDNEIEVVGTFEESEKNGKISLDPSRAEDDRNILTNGITFILIGALISIVLILLTVIICRKKKNTKKVRLPADPEAANATELQDMLLPKPPENGIKVLPKPYTNGTAPVSNGKAKEADASDKEETVPVLAPEPEPDQEPVWDDKPEPIEAVTARLTMLARPQTPIFIQKSLT